MQFVLHIKDVSTLLVRCAGDYVTFGNFFLVSVRELSQPNLFSNNGEKIDLISSSLVCYVGTKISKWADNIKNSR